MEVLVVGEDEEDVRSGRGGVRAEGVLGFILSEDEVEECEDEEGKIGVREYTTVCHVVCRDNRGCNILSWGWR